MKLFNEEQVVLTRLLEEWYTEIKAITEEANGIFSAKAQLYDKNSPCWERHEWPFGFVAELIKKLGRVRQLVDSDRSFIDIADDVNEELVDIMNYARMYAAINNMIAKRDISKGDPRKDWERVYRCAAGRSDNMQRCAEKYDADQEEQA